MANKKKINGIQKVILFFGERLEIIFFFVFILVLIVSGRATLALSNENNSQNVKHKNNWYQRGVVLPTRHEKKLDIRYSLAVIKITPTPTPVIVINTNSNGVWEKLADCETHGNWNSNTGNGYFGGLQFNQSTWNGTGGTGNPASASKEEQIIRGKILQAARGWEPWTGCSRKLGLI